MRFQEFDASGRLVGFAYTGLQAGHSAGYVHMGIPGSENAKIGDKIVFKKRIFMRVPDNQGHEQFIPAAKAAK